MRPLADELRTYVTSLADPEWRIVAKERLSKAYRLAVLDSRLLKSRLLQEVRCLRRARTQAIPAVLGVLGNTLLIEYVDRGQPVKHCIAAENKDRLSTLGLAIGKAIGELHSAGIVHGDLTTSNMLVCDDELTSIWLIDFGLAQVARMAEDRAVDLYVLERALTATHSLHAAPIGYAETAENPQQVLAKLDEVRLRGRKKSMLG